MCVATFIHPYSSLTFEPPLKSVGPAANRATVAMLRLAVASPGWVHMTQLCMLTVCAADAPTLQVLSNLTILGISTNRTDRIGVRMRKEGFRPKHPVVIVPGVQTAPWCSVHSDRR